MFYNIRKYLVDRYLRLTFVHVKLKTKVMRAKLDLFLKCNGETRIFHKEIDVEAFIQEQIQKDILSGEESVPSWFDKDKTTVEVSIDSVEL